jgi:hypothetical protein
MMSVKPCSSRGNSLHAVSLTLLLLLVLFTPLSIPTHFVSDEAPRPSSHQSTWDGYQQPWAQYARTPTHNQTMPPHGPDGGPGNGNVSDVTVLATIEHPTINWQAFDTGDGSDAYGSVIGDFSQSITASEAAVERCGAGTLFPVMISSSTADGSWESFLNIVSGNDAKVAWRVSLGVTEPIRSTPIIHDINADGFQEIIVVYDTQGAMNIDIWSPRLTCTESNWQTSGHSNELLWSYADADVRIASPSPHFPTENSGHKAVTQPLLADLELDGTPELVLAVVDDPDNNPSVYLNAYTLTNAQPSAEDWSVNLDRGTHPSDPVWAQLDSSTTSVLLTTIDANSGNMWIWKIDGATGSLDWERVAIQGTDSDQDAPRLRLPGPVITQLDGDAAPEMILTVPTDPNGRTSGTGARFIGMELTSTNELFNFRAQNGYADAQPLPLDTDDDGISDRLCWVTWYSDSAINFDRKGMLGCTDISDATPVNEWIRDLQRGSGNDNDEIAVSPPIWMDIDGEGAPEIVVGFGRRLWAFDGDTGASADINNEWSTPLSMPHRVWAAPAIADVDGDGHLDLLYGDTLVSTRGVDLAPSFDNRGLSFNPAQADPGDTVTVTAQFSNIGTAEANDDVDAVIRMNGVEIGRERFTSSEPVAPTSEGGPLTFTAEFTAQLGIHTFELVLDVNNNISEQREDNNRAFAVFTVVEPFVAELDGPLQTPRVLPGSAEQVELTMTSTGSRTADWSLSVDTSDLPNDWTFTPVVGQAMTFELTPQTPVQVVFEATVPSSALGDESGVVSFVLSLNSDPTINTTLDLPIEVYRTRGLDLSGPTGLNSSIGQGRPGQVAAAWFMVENLGNAQETTTSISWTAPSWGGSPSIHDSQGTQLFSITLLPGETKELFAQLPTPASAAYGSTTQSTLTLCMGSGENQLCESMPFTFTSQKFVLSPTHHRSLPDATLSWMVTGTLPNSGMVQWNMVEMGMIQTNWQWSATGDWSINGTMLESQGTGGNVVSGELHLSLPPNAVPKRHAFVGVDLQDQDAEFNATLQVLQIFRANLSILQPTPPSGEAVLSLNVSEPQRFLLFLSNPGNGVDTFRLNASVSPDQNGVVPDVTFTFFDPVKTLGALATGIGTVDITLSQETPALTPFTLTFTWTSEGDQRAFDVASVDIQAAPSHEWEVVALNGSELQGRPGETAYVRLSLTNQGNAMDSILLVPSIDTELAGNDASVWSAASVGAENVAVNDRVDVDFEIQIPEHSWAGSKVTFALAHTTSGYTIGETVLSLEILAVSGWMLNLTGADLEIAPDGENLSLQLVHTGNAYETAYYTKAGAGWNITLPDSSLDVVPFATTTFNVFVQPPPNAIAGEIGVLRIRITGNDTSGMIEEEIPVKVGAQPQLHIDHRSTWKVNSLGGYPTAWVENQGNDIAILSIDVADLPVGWSTQQGAQLVLAPGEVAGIPLELTPASDWNLQRFLVTINVHHPILGTLPHSIEVEYSPISFSDLPVRDAFAGSQQSIEYHNTVQEQLTWTSSIDISELNGVLTFYQPSTTGEQVISFTSNGIQGNVSMYIISRTYPDAGIECDFLPSTMNSLGKEVLQGSVATCTLQAGDEEDLRAIFTLTTSDGERVNLLEDRWVVPAGSTESINISLENWDPDAGVFTVYLRGYDQFGRVLASTQQEVTARESGWNIGINSLSTNGDILVGIKRTGYELLTDTVCELTVVASGGWKTTYIVDVAYADFAPVVSIDTPKEIEKDERITVTIACNLPFDLDDNPDDDSMSAYYKPESLLTVSSNELGWVFGIAIVLFAAAWLSGLIRPSHPTVAQRPRKLTETTAQQVPTKEQRERFEEHQPSPTKGQRGGDEDEVERGSQEDTVDEQTERAQLDLIEVFESPAPTENLPANASGRLASLRQEMGTDSTSQPEGKLEDRMKRFFGDG